MSFLADIHGAIIEPREVEALIIILMSIINIGNALVSNTELKKMFSGIWSDVSHISTRDIFQNVFLAHDNVLERPEDFVNHSLYFEAKTFLHGLFVVEDKLSMAHGLENEFRLWTTRSCRVFYAMPS